MVTSSAECCVSHSAGFQLSPDNLKPVLTGVIRRIERLEEDREVFDVGMRESLFVQRRKEEQQAPDSPLVETVRFKLLYTIFRCSSRTNPVLLEVLHLFDVVTVPPRKLGEARARAPPRPAPRAPPTAVVGSVRRRDEHYLPP
ncbi:hypothetical protein EVAR_30088_1 [Eumeta japonica]|uniref:Uncharacterized protein n=1 Tax=Eumeta variegata TaxID=151549 RepID=A0A4C1XBS3_EUMVA|nr:hypothetical protein EVAR_30088_1 [Eumeta japonica]